MSKLATAGSVIPHMHSATPRRRTRIRTGQIARQAILITMALVALLPFFWMALGSFKTYADLISRPSLPPNPFTLANYQEIFLRTPFGSALVNSLIVAIVKVLLTCITSLLLGYIFAKYKFWGKSILFGILLSTMLIPFTAILVPLYLTLSNLGLLNSLSGLIAIGIFSTFGTFLMRQWISGIPDAYIEAARVDGAGEWRIIFRIIAPMAGAPLAALAIFTFLGSWDDFLFPGVILSDPEVKTIPLALNGLKSLFWERYEIFCAGAMVTVIPVMILYALLQKHFVSGLTGGIKG